MVSAAMLRGGRTFRGNRQLDLRKYVLRNVTAVLSGLLLAWDYYRRAIGASSFLPHFENLSLSLHSGHEDIHTDAAYAVKMFPELGVWNFDLPNTRLSKHPLLYDRSSLDIMLIAKGKQGNSELHVGS